MVASHKGLESLGRVLTLGVTTCTLTSLIFLPAVLALVRPGRAEADQEDDNETAESETAETETAETETAGADDDAVTVPFEVTKSRRAA